MRTNRLLGCLLIAAAVFPIAAAGDEVVIPLPGEGEGRYVMVLWESGTPGPEGIPVRNVVEPDISVVGGSLLHSDGSQRVIDLPVASAAELRQHPSVKYLQRVWMGEPPEEINEAPLSAVGKRKGIATEDDPVLWELDYAYDGSGNIKQIGPDNYTYDTAGRLIQATVGGKTEKFKYDPFGNLTELAVDGAAPVKVAVDASNRLTGVSYDPAGNALNSNSATYWYDSLNMLIQVINPAGPARHYVYDVNDELVGTITTVGSSRWTMRDFDGRVLREYTGDSPTDWTYPWVWRQDFVYGEGHVVGGESPQIKAFEKPEVIYGGVRHYHLDHLQSVRMVTDSEKRITARNDHYPFGVGATVTNQEAAFLADFQIDEQRFAGHQRDYLGALNLENRDYLDYMHARYYDPNLGRFLSVDPAMDLKKNLPEPQRWNRYAYVTNNPLRYTDPDGRDRYQEPGFTKPYSEWGEALQMDENTPTVVKVSNYAAGGLTALGAAGFMGAGSGLVSLARAVLPRIGLFGGGAKATIDAVQQVSKGDARIFQNAMNAARTTGRGDFMKHLDSLVGAVRNVIPDGQVFKLGAMNGQTVYGSTRSGIGIVQIDTVTKVVQRLEDGTFKVLGNFR
jgi:RHS repeat-associated protein